MQQTPDQALISLRAAVAWAQYLADANGDKAAAAKLSEVLDIVNRPSGVVDQA
jgi:hypothetical protein